MEIAVPFWHSSVSSNVVALVHRPLATVYIPFSVVGVWFVHSTVISSMTSTPSIV